MKLQSLSTFVLEQTSKEKGFELCLARCVSAAFSKIRNYTEFLTQPLDISMFVPTSDEGTILEKPKNFDEWLSQYQKGFVHEYEGLLMIEYLKALEKVLFAGFEVKESVYDNTGQSLFVGWEPYNVAIFIKLKGEDWKLDGYQTIEDLLLSGYEIELTESVPKQIGIDE